VLPRIAVECRAAADPELRFAPSGVAVARLRVVASDRRKNDQGEWEDADTLWLDVTAFKQLAENVAESVEKGDLLVITGKIRTEQWENADGEKRSKIAMIADTVSASMQFRTLPHGAGRASRSSEPAASRDDPWAAGQTDEPPF
jgi:single-strand DNA-binding protein